MNGEPEILKTEGESPSAAIDGKVIDAELGPQNLLDDSVSVSLKYYSDNAECFSQWQQRELKAFSRIIEKLRGLKWSQVQACQGATCHKHHPSKRVSGFSRPKSVSEDLQFYNIHVDSKARIHGFQINSVFYLVWLDRNHRYQA